MLPGCFPQNFDIKTKNPDKPKVLIEYPCTMLNIEVDERCNNAQSNPHPSPSP